MLKRFIFALAVSLTINISFGASFTYVRDRRSSDEGQLSYRCLLPPATGLCRAYFRMYYYNATTNTCNRFVFGGCSVNRNRFFTGEDCVEACGGTIDDTTEIRSFHYDYDFDDYEDPCDKSKDEGICDALIPRFYFDGNECTSFYWGGCGGNTNNFPTKEACLDTCDHKISDEENEVKVSS